MPRLSANLGFLWADLALPEAIRAAARAGFDAVECHWPYAFDPGAVRAALDETGLEMLGLNTVRGGAGENGLLALPGREAEARAAIAQALDYAGRIGCKAVHVMAGFAEGPKKFHRMDGSGAERSRIQPSHGAWRNSMVTKITL